MRGLTSFCSICGAEGRIYGCPSYNDVCRDTARCRDRAIENKNREILKLKKELESHKYVKPAEV